MSRIRPMPEDFAEHAGKWTKYLLGRHYKAGNRTVDRWVAEAGIEPVRASAKTDNQIKPDAFYYSRMAFKAPERVTSRHDFAADIIRKYTPVFRCDGNGKYNPVGKLWRVGWNILTGDELLERAETYKIRARKTA